MAPPSRKKPPSTGPSEADIATNRALLHYAEASRLAKSLLGNYSSTSGQDDHDTEQEEKAERELLKRQDLFSDTGGVGYRAPESLNGSNSRPAVMDPTTTFLRRQLLSGRAGASQNGLKGHNATVTRPRHQAQRSGKHDLDSDEDSRATVGEKGGTSKNTKAAMATDRTQAVYLIGEPTTNVPAGSEVASQDDNGLNPAQQSSSATASQPKPAKKRGTSSYLDELLASRAAKKQKKNKAKSSAGEG
ncbi:hypothetical protein H2200_006331 [Cladophialophora chaetospira]|uniref:Uncharacterized protein n=1 Tax=Cladophialophora chaetospira TaxID=386627 RepID=A0AA38XAV8_9EURO|nr:hypothetical protein H2200_006331 [Cladophialophora chaetospira]